MLKEKALREWKSVGNTPVTYLENLSSVFRSEFFVKQESLNPTGSVKDRGGMFNILQRVLSGHITINSILLDASSGNMASAIAYYGNRLGLNTEVVCSSKLTSDKAIFIQALNSKLIYHGNITLDGNNYCREIVRSNPNYVFLDQLHSFNNPMGSYVSLGPEIIKQIPDVEIIVGSIGSGGSLYGTAKFLKAVNPDILFVPVHAQSGSRIPGVGGFSDGDYITPFITAANSESLWESPVEISSDNALLRMRDLHRNEGLMLGKQMGALIEAIPTVIERYGYGKKILFINGDAAWKNTEFIKQSLDL